MLERLVEATYTRDRRRHLTAANLGIEKLRFLCRLAKDLGRLDARRYEHAARALDETGRLLDVLERIVDASNPQEPVHLYCPGDDLFTAYERRRGLLFRFDVA